MNGGEGRNSAAGGSPAAFFDVDGTLASSNIVTAFLDFQLPRLPAWRRWAWMALFAPRLPYYAVLDTISRSAFNVTFFRNYARVDCEELEQWAEEALEGFWKPHLYPRGVEQVRRHQEQGHRTVLVGGGIEQVLQPLAQWLGVDLLVGAEIQKDGACFTGRLIGGPLNGLAKAEATRRAAASLDIDLERSYAYTDSYHDSPFLATVGHPVAVNPDWRLRRVARRRGWPICTWRRAWNT